MQKIIANLKETTCACDWHQPKLRNLRLPAYVQQLARIYKLKGMSAQELLYWIEAELYDHHTGRLFDHNGKLIDLGNNPEITDNCWRVHEARTINRILERAEGDFTKLLQMRLVLPVTLMVFAFRINECRINGKCAKDSLSSLN